MASFLTNGLERYLPPHAIPLYVEEVAAGAHPERRFHGHTFMEIVLILAGEGVHLIGEKAVPIHAGDVLLIHPGISHGYDRTSTLGLVNLVYDPRKLSLPLLDGQQMPLFDRLFNPRPRVVSMSRRNFFRHFRNATGSTPREYLRDLRMHRALDLLRRTDLSVTEVALKSGFCDGNYLCRLCRELTGMTPRRFRAACRTEATSQNGGDLSANCSPALKN